MIFRISSLLYILLFWGVASAQWNTYQFNTAGFPIRGAFYAPKYTDGSFWVSGFAAINSYTTNNMIQYKDGGFVWHSFSPNGEIVKLDCFHDEAPNSVYFGGRNSFNKPFLFNMSIDGSSSTYREIPLPSFVKWFSNIRLSPQKKLWIQSSPDAELKLTDTGWVVYDKSNSPLEYSTSYFQFFDSTGAAYFTWSVDGGVRGGLSVLKDNQWIHYDTSNSELPHNQINEYHISKKSGIIWLGTQGGIAAYKDGEFKTWDTLGLNSDVVSRIREDSSGNILISISNEKVVKYQFMRFRDNAWELYASDTLIKNYNIFDLKHLPDGRVVGIAGTHDGKGFYIFDDSKWVHYTRDSSNGIINCPDSVYNNGIFEVGADGRVYIRYQLNFSRRGISTYDPKTNEWRDYTPYNTNLANDTIHSLTVDNSNTKWISTNYGISRFNDSGWYAWDSTTLGMQKITSLFADSKGRIWGGCNTWRSGNGLLRYENGIWSKDTTSLPTKEINDIAEDKRGWIWVAHREGVSYSDGSAWHHVDKSTTFSGAESARGIAVDSAGNVWVATGKGAFTYDGSAWRVFDSAKGSIPSDYLFDVAVDSFGALWFGSLHAGAIRFDGKTSQSFTPKGIKDMRTLAADRFGNVWAATDSGAIKFTKDQWIAYDTANSELSSNRIGSIAIGRDGSKWFGTKFNGIAQLIDDDTVSTMSDRRTTRVQKNLTLRQTGKSLIISGTTGSGLVTMADLRGRIIWQERIPAGSGAVTISPAVSSGVYVARVSSGDRMIVQKVAW